MIAAALPIIVSAAECSRSTAVKAPVDVVDVFGKISIVVYNAIEVAMKMPDASSSRLRKRAEVEVELGTTNCMLLLLDVPGYYYSFILFIFSLGAGDLAMRFDKDIRNVLKTTRMGLTTRLIHNRHGQ